MFQVSHGPKTKNTARGLRFLLRFNMYLFLAQCEQVYLFFGACPTFFVLLLLLLLVPPSAAVVPSPAVPASLLYAPKTRYFLRFRLYNIFMEKFNDKKAYFLSPQVAETGGWRGFFFIREAAKRQFLVDISMWLLNELKSGWICRAHYIPEQSSVTPSTQGKCSLAERVRKMHKNTCYSALGRGIYEQNSNTWHHLPRLYQAEVLVTYQNRDTFTARMNCYLG